VCYILGSLVEARLKAKKAQFLSDLSSENEDFKKKKNPSRNMKILQSLH